MGKSGARLEVEDLAGDVLASVYAAHEAHDLPADDLLDAVAEVLLRRVLEEHPGVAQTLVLPHLREVALGTGHRVPEGGDQGVGPGEVRGRSGRAAAEVL